MNRCWFYINLNRKASLNCLLVTSFEEKWNANKSCQKESYLMSFPSVPFQDLYWEIFWMNSQNPLHILFLLLTFTFFHVSVNSISLSLISLVTMFHLSDEATLACVKLTNYCHCLNLNLKIRQPNNKIHMLPSPNLI